MDATPTVNGHTDDHPKKSQGQQATIIANIIRGLHPHHTYAAVEAEMKRRGLPCDEAIYARLLKRHERRQDARKKVDRTSLLTEFDTILSTFLDVTAKAREHLQLMGTERLHELLAMVSAVDRVGGLARARAYLDVIDMLVKLGRLGKTRECADALSTLLEEPKSQ